MKKLSPSGRFRKDVKRVQRRGLDLAKLQSVLELLQAEQQLPERCRPHKLSGQYQGVWECHIEPDWLLIYDYTATELQLIRTGTHADLFE
jgi:mRNA interferase YafQ